VETSGRQRNYEYTKIFLPGAEQADVYATVGAPVLEKKLSGQDQLLLMYGQKEARTFTLQGTESSPGLVPQLYWNLFSSLEGRLRPIASHQPSGLHHTVPQDPDQATTTRKMKGVSVFLSAVLVLGESVLDLFTEENALEEARTLLEQADRGRRTISTVMQDLVQELSDTNENLSDQTCNFLYSSL
jgi:hypothetical protein